MEDKTTLQEKIELGKRALEAHRDALGLELGVEISAFERSERANELYRYCYDLFGAFGFSVGHVFYAKRAGAKKSLDHSSPSYRALREDLRLFLNEKRVELSTGEYLGELLEARNMKGSDVYRRGSIDRKLFSRIRAEDYMGGIEKQTALCFAVGFMFNAKEARGFLRHFGYAFNPREETDLIVLRCLENGVYDMATVDSLLMDNDLDPLSMFIYDDVPDED